MPEGLGKLHERCAGSALALSAAASGRPFAWPGTAPRYADDSDYRVKHLAAELDIDLERRRVDGMVAIDVERVASRSGVLALDAVGMDVRRVQVGRKGARFEYDGEVLRIQMPERSAHATVRVHYAAEPKRGLYFLRPDAHVPNRPRQAWTQFQEEGARHVIPCVDSPGTKMTLALTLRVENGHFALANGKLTSEAKPTRGKWRYAYELDLPLPTYLISIVVGHFHETRARAGKVGLRYLVPPSRAKDAKRTFGRTPEMLKLFGEKFGVPYPWGDYTQIVVSDFIFGGMENTTVTTLYEEVMLDARAAIDVTSEDLIAHELAHHWFGNYVTCREWSEAWLNEGFATFMEQVWREHAEGRDEYFAGLAVDLAGYLGEARGRYRRSVVCREFDAPLQIFDRHLYEKGGLVLHALRMRVGDEAFWASVHHYLEAHAHGGVETIDWIRSLESTSKLELREFADQWLHSPGHPELDVRIRYENGLLLVSVKQTHSTSDGVPAAFKLPLTLDIAKGRRSPERRVLDVRDRVEQFAVPMSERPKWIVVDADLQVIGVVRLRAPTDMLKAQIRDAPTARGRVLALDALPATSDMTVVELVGRVLRDESGSWIVRAAAARALGRIRGEASKRALVRATSVDHPKVRRAVATALGAFRDRAAADGLRSLAESDPSYLVQSSAAHALGRTKQSIAYDVLVELLDRDSWAEVVRSGALRGLAELEDERAGALAIAMAKYGKPTRARRTAISAFEALLEPTAMRKELKEHLDDEDPYLRIDVVRQLGGLDDARARELLRGRLERELDPRVARQLGEVLREASGSSAKAVSALKSEMQMLRSDLADLAARLSAAEARIEHKKGGSGARRGRTHSTRAGQSAKRKRS